MLVLFSLVGSHFKLLLLLKEVRASDVAKLVRFHLTVRGRKGVSSRTSV